MRLGLAIIAIAAATSVTAQESGTDEMRRNIVEQKAYEACSRVYGSDPDQALLHPVCYELIVKYGIPE